MGYSLCVDPYHAEVVRGALTRNIATCFADVHDEMKAAFEDNIPMTKSMETWQISDTTLADIVIDWIEVSAYQTVLQIVCRASNRMFIGLPICK